MNHFLSRYWFCRFSGTLPSPVSTFDGIGIVSILPENIRHTGAGCFAQSGAIQVDFFILRQSLHFLWETVWLKANRTWDPHGSNIIVPVASRIRDNDFSLALLRVQPLCQYLYMNSRHVSETPTFPVIAESLDKIESQAKQQYPLDRLRERRKAKKDFSQ
jgi:hypothetical protein